MAVLTVMTVAGDANSSLRAVESQKVAIVRIATVPATGWMILIMGFPPALPARFDLRDADVWHRDLLEKVRRSDGRGRIGGEFRREFRMRERSPKGSGRFPDGLVQISRAFADSPMKLGRYEARLPFHERRIVLPDLEEGRFVGLVEREQVDEHDRRGIERDLTFDRESGIQRAQQ